MQAFPQTIHLEMDEQKTKQLKAMLGICQRLGAETRYHPEHRYFTAMVWTGWDNPNELQTVPRFFRVLIRYRCGNFLHLIENISLLLKCQVVVVQHFFKRIHHAVIHIITTAHNELREKHLLPSNSPIVKRIRRFNCVASLVYHTRIRKGSQSFFEEKSGFGQKPTFSRHLYIFFTFFLHTN